MPHEGMPFVTLWSSRIVLPVLGTPEKEIRRFEAFTTWRWYPLKNVQDIFLEFKDIKFLELLILKDAFCN